MPRLVDGGTAAWRRPTTWVVLVALAGVAAHVMGNVLGDMGPGGMPSYDVYNYYFPNMLYALATLHHGLRGVFWNALQNCGQPFFGISSTGVLYPANLFYLLLAPVAALQAVVFFNLLVAGTGGYFWCRSFGASRPAALAGAFAFQLGNANMFLAAWGPQMSSSWIWLPWAMGFCERIFRAPSASKGMALGVVLGIALLPGTPQSVFLTYQLIALRVAWELVATRFRAALPILASIGLGLVLAPMLVAVHLLPSIESAAASVRSSSLDLAAVNPYGDLDWQRFRMALAERSNSLNPLLLVPLVLASAGVVYRATWRPYLFYLTAGALFLVLGFGSSTPLYGLYVSLPVGSLFREASRLLWLPSFCLAGLCAAGVDAVGDTLQPGSRVGWRLGTAGVCLVGLIAFFLISPLGLQGMEWAIGGAVVAVTLLGSRLSALRPAVLWTAAAVVLLSLLVVHRSNTIRILPTADFLFANRAAFLDLRQRMTANDRIYIAGRLRLQPDDVTALYRLMQKSASLFGTPSIHDYEPQPGRRYAEYFVRLRTGRPFRSLNDVYFPDGWLLPGLQRRLLDLAAARYLVVAARVDKVGAVMNPPPRPVSDFGDVRVYENPTALPRAFFVPSVEVEPDPQKLLQRLAVGDDDLRRVALVEAPPSSGFTGDPGAGGEVGAVGWLANDPEHLRLRVQAPRRGFLFVADQFDSNWRATVNGAETPIERGNYLFRLIEVPAGESIVEMRYVPVAAIAGALVSTLTIAGIALAAVRIWRRRRVAGSAISAAGDRPPAPVGSRTP